MQISLKTTRDYINSKNPDIVDWELTFDNQNHVLRGEQLIKIVNTSIKEIFNEDFENSIEEAFLSMGYKIISKIGKLAD